MATSLKAPPATECRQCCSFCDKLIEPRGCVAAGCPSLYSYVDERSSRRYMGCLHKVFAVEIDVALFEQLDATPRGFGGVKAVAEPFAHCPFTVERSYEGDGEAFACSNRRFHDCSERGPGAYRAQAQRGA